MRTILVILAVVALIGSAAAQSLPVGFVYLRDIDPTIIQDMRYATSNNFVGHPLAGYGAAECVVKREVGLRLKAIQQELAKEKLSLKMFDCYRPQRAVMDMYRWSQNGKETPADRRFNPAFRKADLFRLGYIATYSGHSTGSALDLTLVDLTADNSATFDPAEILCRLHRAGRRPRARGQHRHGHRIRLHGPQGSHQFERDHAGATQMAHHVGGGDAQARLCQLLEGVVALFAARRRRPGL